jgi:hypothetical protein
VPYAVAAWPSGLCNVQVVQYAETHECCVNTRVCAHLSLLHKVPPWLQRVPIQLHRLLQKVPSQLHRVAHRLQCAGNWQWLSCSRFFYQYFRVYSPVTFGQKYDKNGNYIRHFVPALKDFPAKYIYEPWTAPMDVQRKANCIIGQDYPKPIVDHKEMLARNKSRMAEAYALNKEGKADDIVVQNTPARGKRSPGKSRPGGNKKRKRAGTDDTDDDD